MEYLNQRESQISNILESYGREEADAGGKDPPDKKLKTSEGRPDPVQSPPANSKTPTDSESDADSSSDSIIQKIKQSSTRPATASAVSDTTAATDSARDQAAAEQPQASPKRKPTRSFAGVDPIIVTSDPSSKEAVAGLRSAGGGAGNICGAGDSPAKIVPGWIQVEGGAGKCSPAADERLHQPSRAASPTTEGEQLEQSTPTIAAATVSTPKRSIFSPDRAVANPETIGGRGASAREHESPGQKENESPVNWRSPRDGKPAEGRSPRLAAATLREKQAGGLGPAKSPAQSPALSRSFEAVVGGLARGSPQLTNRSPAVAVAQSPVKSSPHQPPVNRTAVDSPLKSHVEETAGPELLLLPALNKSDNEPEELPGSSNSDIGGRKYSVESKDSDADSAKSSLLDANEAILRDFGKEEEEEMGRNVIAEAAGKVFSSDNDEVMSLARQQQQHQAQMLLSSGVQQAKMDEGYVSAEKVHPADPIGQSLALFETSLMGMGAAEASKRSREPAVTPAIGLQQQQLNSQNPGIPNIKSPTAVPSIIPTATVLQAQRETADLDFSRHQDFTTASQMGKKQQQQKSAEEELAHYFNHAVATASAATAASGLNSAASTAASMSSWSEPLQHLQQQQLQQQLQLMDSRSWQASSFSGQVEPVKAKQPAPAAVAEHNADKKATESMLAAASQQQQQQQYQEALFTQMLSYQTKQMNHQQQLAYAQQYMKVREQLYSICDFSQVNYFCIIWKKASFF